MILGDYAPLAYPALWTHSLGRLSRFNRICMRKEKNSMKKYIAPEMESLSFAALEAIGAPLDGSNTYNDGELEW